ncbi:sex comb on midleg-like protein 4 isoform X3 [Phascolarctos cinereus]
MAEMQSPRIAGRKRGRPPLHSAPMKMAVHNLYSSSACSLPVVKIPKKRGRKPGHKQSLLRGAHRSQMSAPSPRMQPPYPAPQQQLRGSQDCGCHPPEVPPQLHRGPGRAICIYVNKQANLGPYLERKKVQQLPEHFGPERPSAVLQQAVQAFIDCALQQKTVFSLVKQGYGGEMMSAKTVISEDYLADPVGMKRYSMDPSNSAFNCTGSSSSSSLYSGRLSSGEGCLGRGLTTSSCSHRSGPVSSSGPSTVGLRHQASSFLRNGTYSEGNKSASSPSPDGQDAARPTSKNPSTWTVEDVVWFVKDADPQALGPHVELFRKHHTLDFRRLPMQELATSSVATRMKRD